MENPNTPNGDRNQNNQNNNAPRRQSFFLFLIAALLSLLCVSYFMKTISGSNTDEITYNEFIQKLEDGEIDTVVIGDNQLTITPKKTQSDTNMTIPGTFMTGLPSVTTYITGKAEDDTALTQRLLQYSDVKFQREVPESSSMLLYILLYYILPILLMWGLLSLLFRRISKSGGGFGGMGMGVGKSNAKVYVQKETGITFKDVAGEDEAKESLVEIVGFLHNPERYNQIGARLPKGALLVGPPGTGKTLLAKAVAGEAGVPFFSLTGSDFIELYVGVGASRVRDLFKEAEKNAPCIVFIDEIDAVGRARGKNPAMGGNDERENTLNQLLTEMDGFGSNSGVIILAATNRVDVLDKALLRAGRFDRQIHVDLPDLNERKEVFGVHLRPIKIDKTVDVDLLARQTPGFSGADIANVCNEAALIAARHGKKFVGKQDFLDAVDRIIGGLEKKTKITTEAERRSIALHEAGHAAISWLLEYANPLIKVTIVPRGRALGAAWYLPEERQITTKEQMLDEMCATLGGRAAEDLFLGRISTGAMNDLERVTKQAYGMIAYLGMSDKLPNLCYYNNDEYSFNRPYSEKTAELIDEEVKKMINEQYERAKQILSEHKEGHNKLAQILMEKEVIFAEDVERIFGKRPWASRSEEIMAAQESQDAAKAEKELAKKVKGEEKEIKEEEEENTAKGETTSTKTKVTAEGTKVTVEKK